MNWPCSVRFLTAISSRPTSRTAARWSLRTRSAACPHLVGDVGRHGGVVELAGGKLGGVKVLAHFSSITPELVIAACQNAGACGLGRHWVPGLIERKGF